MPTGCALRHPARSPTRCAPAWTAWPQAVAVVLAAVVVTVVVAVTALAAAVVVVTAVAAVAAPVVATALAAAATAAKPSSPAARQATSIRGASAPLLFGRCLPASHGGSSSHPRFRAHLCCAFDSNSPPFNKRLKPVSLQKGWHSKAPELDCLLHPNILLLITVSYGNHHQTRHPC